MVQYSYITMNQILDDTQLFQEIKSGNKAAFDTLFKKYYTALCRFSNTIILSEELAEEAVQDVFVRLWEKRKSINISEKAKSYLYKSVYNQCIWLIKKQKTKQLHEDQYAFEAPKDFSEQDTENWEAFRPFIQVAVNNLPDKCRHIFMMKRYEGLTNQEISDYLGISIKTVEKQMTVAIQKLRTELKPYIKNIIILIFIENF